MIKPKNRHGLFLIVSKLTLSLFIMEMLLSGNVLAFYPQKIAVSGSTDNLKKTIKSIDKYTPIIKEDIKEDKIDQSFIGKPEIAQTRTREEMDRQKQEEQKKLNQKSRDVAYRDIARPVPTTEKIEKNIDRSSNNYWYGFCTWYVAEKRPDVPNQWGNAGNWLNSAQNSGWPTGTSPAVGAIIVTRESWVGHVGYVEKVEGNSITISEMNYKGWGTTNTRTLDINNPVIKGFIY